MMPAGDWESVNDDWAEHDLCRGAQEGMKYPGVLAARFGPLVNLPDFVRKAQLANFEAFRAMYEGRNAKLFHPCTGVLTWMSNPAQPSFVWQLYSYDLEPNSSLFAARLACEPVHIQMNEDNFHVMVINNRADPLRDARAIVTVANLDGAVQSRREIPVSAEPSMATDLGAAAWEPGLSPVHFVELELRDSRGQPVSRNFYWRASPQRPDDFLDLRQLGRVALDATVARRDAGGRCLLRVTLANPSKDVALMAHVQLRGQRSGQRILPVYYTDNYVSLLPGESAPIDVEAEEAALGGDTPLVVLDGWNTTVAPRSFPDNGGAAIAPNTDAMVDAGAARTFTYQHVPATGSGD
jgi:Exo-beta-D-glucosaminidase Ig-fold domain